MYNHIGHYLALNVAQPLARQFGDRLEDMPKAEKLLLINVLSGGLHELETCPALNDYSFIQFCRDEDMPEDLLADVLPLLQMFDQHDSQTIEKILMVLVLSMQ